MVPGPVEKPPLQASPARRVVAAEVAEVVDGLEVDVAVHGHGWVAHRSKVEERLAERRFVEAAQLTGVQPAAFLAQQVDGGQADLQMLADGALIKGVRLARQLDLTVQRLVRDA